MNYEQAHALVIERGKKWNDFIEYMKDKPYEIDKETHYILYPPKHVYKFTQIT